jgi:hypothetical protein
MGMTVITRTPMIPWKKELLTLERINRQTVTNLGVTMPGCMEEDTRAAV